MACHLWMQPSSVGHYASRSGAWQGGEVRQDSQSNERQAADDELLPDRRSLLA